jgi:hypothetical protein
VVIENMVRSTIGWNRPVRRSTIPGDDDTGLIQHGQRASSRLYAHGGVQPRTAFQ